MSTDTKSIDIAASAHSIRQYNMQPKHETQPKHNTKPKHETQPKHSIICVQDDLLRDKDEVFIEKTTNSEERFKFYRAVCMNFTPLYQFIVQCGEKELSSLEVAILKATEKPSMLPERSRIAGKRVFKKPVELRDIIVSILAEYKFEYELVE